MIIYMWTRSRHKVSFSLVAGLVVCLVVYTTSSTWTSRISTISDYQNENSALSRLLVWKWTLDYASTHPLGGGFAAYLIDHIDVPATETEPAYTQFGRAFHSIYFEVLGEQGYPGLIIFLSLAGLTLIKLRRLAKRARSDPELAWVVGLSNALQSGLAVFMTSGAFVGIAFQPMFWYFISMSISLVAYMRRVDLGSGEPAPGPGWRNRPVRTPANLEAPVQ